MAGTCECGNELSSSIKCGESLDGSIRTLLHDVSKYVSKLVQ